jgi:hypothetical protein
MVVQRPPAQKFDAHARLHLPQFSGSFSVAVSQPFVASPSHSAVPGSHGPSPHTPFQQAPPSSHTLPQTPQLALSVSGFRQMPSQQSQSFGHVSLVSQLGAQTASTHVVPARQLLSL